MNPKLKEINELIALCDQMLAYIQERGDIRPNNELYLSYKSKVNSFCKDNKINERQYAPYVIFYTFYFKNAYIVNAGEVSAIRDALVKIKHSLFRNDYEKNFYQSPREGCRASCRLCRSPSCHWHTTPNNRSA